jgi:hypothetical protein
MSADFFDNENKQNQSKYGMNHNTMPPTRNITRNIKKQKSGDQVDMEFDGWPGTKPL